MGGELVLPQTDVEDTSHMGHLYRECNVMHFTTRRTHVEPQHIALGIKLGK